MTAEIRRVLERVRQNRAARASDPRTARTPGAAPAIATIGGFAAGDRAFDLITGQPVEVLGGGTENVLVPTPNGANR